jgi:FlaA1/EpsC-like NDP-sugar epimerase
MSHPRQMPSSDCLFEQITGRRSICSEQIVQTKAIFQKIILITGAGGSVGAALCRLVLTCEPSRVIMVDRCEAALHRMAKEFEADTRVVSALADVGDICAMDALLDGEHVDIVLHGAAHKHVPMAERFPIEYIRNNIFATKALLEATQRAGVGQFLLVSTDKAVDPVGVMGATKRVAELVVLAASTIVQPCSAVRFGNVFGSSGSVVERFRSDIENGDTLKVTDPQMTRFFMTDSEAAYLIVEAVGLAKGSEIFSLILGESVLIADVAERLIDVLGGVGEREPQKEIEFVGIRAGERLHEPAPAGLPTGQLGILCLNEPPPDSLGLEGLLESLRCICEQGREVDARRALMELATMHANKMV